MWLTGLVAPRHVGSSQTRARTRVPCVGRQILNHCTTREAPILAFNIFFLWALKNFLDALVYFHFFKKIVLKSLRLQSIPEYINDFLINFDVKYSV